MDKKKNKTKKKINKTPSKSLKKVVTKRKVTKKKKNKYVVLINNVKKYIKKKIKTYKTKFKTYKKNRLKNKISKREELARKIEEQNIKDIRIDKKYGIEEKEQEEKTKVNFKLILSIILVVFIISLAVLILNHKDESVIEFNYITLKKYQDLYKKEELQYIYITKDNCTYCELLDPEVIKLEEEYKIEFEVLNISKLSKKDLEKLKASNSAFEEDWDAPILITIKDGQEVSNLKSYKEYTVLKKFIDYSMNPSDNNSFIKIDVNKYLNVLNSKDASLVYICRSNNKSCDMFSSILEETSTEEEVRVYYLNTDSIDTDKEWEKLNNSNDLFKKTWFVPAILVVKNGEIISYKMETMDKESLIEFFNKNGL